MIEQQKAAEIERIRIQKEQEAAEIERIRLQKEQEAAAEAERIKL